MDFSETADTTTADVEVLDRPPAPEVATVDDIAKYNQQWLANNPQVADTSPPVDPEEAYFAKQADGFDDDTRSRAEFPWLFDPQRGRRWDFDPIALRNLAQGNTWVGMLVQSITKEVAETPFTVVRADDPVETQKRLSTHPEHREVAKADLPDQRAERIYDLLHNPNPDDSWHDLVEMWLGDLLEVGSGVGVKAFPEEAYDDDGEEFVADADTVEPRGIVPSAPEVWTKDYRGKTGFLDGFWQFDDHKSPGTGTTDGRLARGSRGVEGPTFFSTDEILWNDMTPRTNRGYGMPPTLLVEDFLQSLDLAIQQEQEYLSRGSIPSGAWIFENWDREELKERKQEMAENVKGKPHKSLMFAGQQGDVRFEPMSMNFQELEFTERMRWYARVVASVFQVPTAVVGIEPEKVNYNTFQGERENFENNTLGPYLQDLERWLHNDLLTGPFDGYRVEFQPGMSETTRDMISSRVRSEFEAGIRTRNEARREVGLPEVDADAEGFKDEVVEDDGGDGLDEILGNSLSKTDDGRDGSGDDGTRLSGSGDVSVKDSDALRDTDEWYLFDVQPSDVERVREAIADDVDALFEEVLSDEQIQRVIERLAADTTDKSESDLARRLREVFAESEVIARIERALSDATAEAVREGLEGALSEADADVDVDVQAIEAQLADRDVAVAEDFADRLSREIRETVADGWAEGKNSREIASDIAEQGDMAEGWTGAERIARQEIQIASGKAREEVAGQLEKVRVWDTAGDGRVREAHQEMDGKWARPGENFVVEYEDRGVQKESVPGDSRPSIGCRCVQLLRDRGEVDDADYAGDGGLN